VKKVYALEQSNSVWKGYNLKTKLGMVLINNVLLKSLQVVNYIGFLYENRFVVKQNYSNALDYYQKSIELNNSDALNNIGDLYYNGYN
jgi:TPR repeat protein